MRKPKDPIERWPDSKPRSTGNAFTRAPGPSFLCTVADVTRSSVVRKRIADQALLAPVKNQIVLEGPGDAAKRSRLRKAAI